MILLRQFFRFFDLVCEETTPNRVAGGLVLGLFLGILPPLTLQAAFLVLVALVIRVQLPAVGLGWLLGMCFGTIFDPVFHATGLFLLKSATLRSTWSFLYHAPLFPYTRFNNSVLFGICVLFVPVAPALYVVLSRTLGRYWGTLATRVMYTSFWNHWQSGLTARLYRDYHESNPRKRIPTGPFKGGLHYYLLRLVRFDAFPWVGGAAVVALAVVWFGKEAYFRRQLELQASRMNGAKVEIGSVELHPFSGEALLSDVQIGNPSVPSRNLFQIRKVRMEFLLEPLVRKKLVFPKMTVEGVQLDTDRNDSAALPESDLYVGVAGLVERAAPGYYADVRNALKSNPLRHLGSLSSGLSLNPRVDQLRTKLETLTTLEKQDREIETLSARWEAGKLNLPAPKWIQGIRAKLGTLDPGDKEAALKEVERARAEIAEALASVGEIAASLTESLGSVQRDLASLTPNLDSDIVRVKEALKLPDFSMDDLSPQLFGGPVLAGLERLAYWIDLSRRRMPLGDVKEKMALVIRDAPRGTDLFYANRSGSPELLLLNIELIPDPATPDAVLKGNIVGLTSEPSFYLHPATANIEANFPSQHIEKLKFTMTLDHTGAQFKDELSLQAAMLPLNALSIHETSGLSVSIDKAVVALGFNAKFEGDNVKADWNAQIDNAQYTVTSRFLPEETILKRLLTPIQSIQLTGAAEGPKDQMHLNFESNLGKVLVAGLRQEFRHALGAIDDSIRRSILDKAEPTRRALASRLSQLRQGALQTVNRSLKDLQDLASEADTLKGRLENPKGKTTASRIRPLK